MAASKTTTETITTSTDHLVLQGQPPKEKFRRDYRPPEWVIKHVSLDFDLDYERTVVTSELTMYRLATTKWGTDLILDGDELRCISASVDSTHLTGTLPVSGNLTIPGTMIPKKDEEIFKVKTVVEINPSKNTLLMGLFKTDDLLATQCESTGFRRITFMLDRPDVMSKYRVRLQGPKSKFPVLLSNGNEEEKGDLENGLHYAIYTDPHLKPCYLFALVAGNLECITDTYKHPDMPNSKSVKLNVWSNGPNLPKLQWSMDSIKMAMKWDTDVFGLEYDLDIFNLVCIRDFNMGAMENKSLNIFVSAALLASQNTTTDQEYLRILGIVGHEYFHNWTGDRVTLRDWFQLTLKEGLTVFRDQQFSADMGSAAVKRIEDIIDMRCRQFPEDAGPMAHPIRPESYIAMENFYTMTVYEKGAEVIRMYHTILGSEGFRKGMDLYFSRHDGSAVTCDDFRSAMADANKFDFNQFERWYTVPGTPTVTVISSNYDSNQKILKLTLTQEVSNTNTKQALHIPIIIGLIGKESKTEIIKSHVLHFTKLEQTFEIENVNEQPIISIFRNWSAPVKCVISDSIMTNNDLITLMGFDTDPVNRWEAGQKVMLEILLNRYNAIVNGKMDPLKPEPLSADLIESLRRFLTDDSLDMAYRAYALVVPAEEAISNDIKSCDPIAVHQARNSLRVQISEALSNEFKKIYEDLTKSLDGKEYKILPACDNVAPRQLRNLCLSYLCITKDDQAAQLSYSHFDKSTNMTDRLSAFRCLLDIKGPLRDKAIARFFDEAQSDPLVMDKWFSMQAGADLPDVLSDVKRLKQHELFTLLTPGRMRSLLSRFAMNLPHFHAQDGSGYQFVADSVIEVDAINGPNASRLAANLASWRRYDENRGSKMKAELERIMSSGTLTPETYETVSKALA